MGSVLGKSWVVVPTSIILLCAEVCTVSYHCNEM